MTHPPADGALARFTVLDLTRYRAGADGRAPARRLGRRTSSRSRRRGRRGTASDPDQGTPTARTSRTCTATSGASTLNLKEPDGCRHLQAPGGERRRGGGELPARRESTGSASTTRRSARSTRASSMPVSPASGRTGRMRSGRASTRSPRAWAGSCRSPASPAGGRCASASLSPISAPGSTRPSASSSRCWSASVRARGSGCSRRCCRR